MRFWRIKFELPPAVPSSIAGATLEDRRLWGYGVVIQSELKSQSFYHPLRPSASPARLEGGLESQRTQRESNGIVAQYQWETGNAKIQTRLYFYISGSHLLSKHFLGSYRTFVR